MAGSDDENPPPPPPPQTPTQQAPHTVSTIKLPILKKGEYDIWAMKMEHYLSHTDYPIWEVIQKGNGPCPSLTPPITGNLQPTIVEAAPMPMNITLQSVQSLGRDEGSVSLNELMDLVTQLTNKVGSLENELTNTKKVYGSAITKLVKRVKKLEKQVKTGKARRRTKIVLSEDEAVEEDSSKQGRSLIEELDMDADFSLVPPHDAEIQEKISDDTEVLLEEEETTELIEEPTELVEDQGSGEKGEQEVTTADTALNTASVPFSTASATPEVSTAAESLVYIRRMYHALQNRPRFVAEVRKNMIIIEEVLESVQEQTDELSQEQLNQMVIIVPDEGIIVEALQTKYSIIGWEVHSDDTMQFWKIIRVGNHIEVYQVFEDMLKNFDRDDLIKLWSLVQERYNSSGLTEDKEIELWVELKMLFEPDAENFSEL
ncbi:hypothetical protein Tco_0474581 [Tanacetum coccineum]